jgi:alkylation response protein AidB-like acyl-CoA dehydrogenase
MRVTLTDEQLAIGSAADDFLKDRAAEPSGKIPYGQRISLDAATWREVAELGWLSLGVPEDSGGVGYGPIEEMVLFREIGRHLARGPFVSTVAAGWVAAAAGADELAAALFSGETRVGMANGDLVVDALSNGLVLEPFDSGLRVREISEITELWSVDATVGLGRATLGETVAEAVDPQLVSRLELLLAAAHLGIAEAVRDMSVSYSLERHQFGKPIGAFQAVKHRCADMAIRCYAAYAQTLFAGSHLERRTTHAAFHTGSARLVASSAARRNAAANIQNHGAIGFTQEHIAAWYVRRAQIWHQCYEPMLTAHRVATVRRERYETLGEPVTDWLSAALPGGLGAAS